MNSQTQFAVTSKKGWQIFSLIFKSMTRFHCATKTYEIINNKAFMYEEYMSAYTTEVSLWIIKRKDFNKAVF